MPNSLICCHPRSGSEWLELRLAMMFCLHPEYGVISSSRKVQRCTVDFSHNGFNDMTVQFPQFVVGERFHTTPRIFALLRNPMAVVASSYYYMKFVESKIREDRGLQVDDSCLPKTINSYAVSNWGAIRLCTFLNGIQDMVVAPGRGGDFLYYEDMFDPSFIGNLPHIAGVSIELSNYEKDLIFRASHKDEVIKIADGTSSVIEEFYNHDDESFALVKSICNQLVGHHDPKQRMLRNATIDSYKEDLSQVAQHAIKEIVARNCRLEIYKQRYL